MKSIIHGILLSPKRDENNDFTLDLMGNRRKIGRDGKYGIKKEERTIIKIDIIVNCIVYLTSYSLTIYLTMLKQIHYALIHLVFIYL